MAIPSWKTSCAVLKGERKKVTCIQFLIALMIMIMNTNRSRDAFHLFSKGGRKKKEICSYKYQKNVTRL